MKTVTGEALNLGPHRTSQLQRGSTQVKFSYRESDVKFPVISVYWLDVERSPKQKATETLAAHVITRPRCLPVVV